MLIGLPRETKPSEARVALTPASVDSLNAVVSAAEVAEAASMVPTVHVSSEVRDYVLDLVAASRRHPDLVLGASPRGA